MGGGPGPAEFFRGPRWFSIEVIDPNSLEHTDWPDMKMPGTFTASISTRPATHADNSAGPILICT